MTISRQIHDEALAVLHGAGLLVESIEFDGKQLHRVPTKDKPKSKNGVYIAYGDPPVSLWWKDWGTGESGTWTAKGENNLTTEEKAKLSQRWDEARKARETAQALIHAEAAKKAEAIYSTAADCTGHSYLTGKGVSSVSGLKVSTNTKYDSLIVPMRNEQRIVGVQFIYPKGDKRFLAGTEKKGSFFSIGKDTTKPLIICEGVATGLSLYECLGLPILVAFDAGNLLPVAKMAREKYPDREIIIAADNDTETDGNPGVTMATATAKAVSGSLAIPDFGGCKGDWNDLHQEKGAEEVGRQFENRINPKSSPNIEQEELPPGFSIRLRGERPGLWYTEHKENDKPIETWLGSPLYVLGRTRDANGNSWGLRLQWKDRDGRGHTWAMPVNMLVGRDASEWLKTLVDRGWIVAPGTHAQKLVALYLSTHRTDRRYLGVPRTGWHHGAFVFPDETIQNHAGRAGCAGQLNNTNSLMPSSNENGLLDVLDNEQIVLQTDAPQNPYGKSGIVEEWNRTIGFWALGNSRLMLFVCASLAAPLLELAGQESGGFNLAGQSSTGKTTALVTAGSVWGTGHGSWRATDNGLEGLAALHSDAALCLDEIGQASSRTVSEASYMLANGTGKTRSGRDGNMRPAKSWRVTVLSTGEIGLPEKIEADGGRVQAGQTVRLVDIPADAGASMGIFEDIHGHESPHAFADALKQAASTHYGHVARAFIRKLVEGREGIQKNILSVLDNAGKIFCPDGASGQVQRVAKRFCLCAIAGELAIEWGILPWKEGDAMSATKTCFDAWLSLRGNSGAAEDSAILERVRLFIEQHGASRFQDVDNPDGTCVNRVGFRQKNETDGITYYILPESFKKEVCKGHDHKRAAAILRDKGWLLPGDTRSFTRRPPVDLPGFGRKRCYILFIGGNPDDLA